MSGYNSKCSIQCRAPYLALTLADDEQWGICNCLTQIETYSMPIFHWIMYKMTIGFGWVGCAACSNTDNKHMHTTMPHGMEYTSQQ